MRNRLTASLAALGIAAAGVAALTGSSPAQATGDTKAIPTLAQACGTNITTVNGGTGWHLMHQPVWVNNSQGFRRTVINVNADADVERGARIVIAYRIDPTGFIQNPGARNFASWSEYPQTRHNMVVMPVGGGWHRVYVYWAVVGSPTAQGSIAGHCITVEGNTA